LFIVVLGWWAVDSFKPPAANLLKPAIVFCGAIYVVGKVITWLRLWGAYIERRLSEIEALLTDERPCYYSEPSPQFDENPLFTKLTSIEDRLERLARGKAM